MGTFPDVGRPSATVWEWGAIECGVEESSAGGEVGGPKPSGCP